MDLRIGYQDKSDDDFSSGVTALLHYAIEMKCNIYPHDYQKKCA